MAGKYGDLTALVLFLQDSRLVWNCKCRCGNTKVIRDEHLKSGASTSCGYCNYPEKHPYAHKSWDSMKQRCNNPNSPDYPRYGAVGIKVTPAWDRFIDFLDDMGDPPIDAITGSRYTLDRIDNSLGYYKENCRWASYKMQAINRSNTLHPGFARYKNGNKRTCLK